MHFRACRKSAGDISLDEPIESDGDGNALALMDVLSSPDDSLDQIELSDRRALLAKCLHTCLNDREREILILRYGLSGGIPMTQREIAGQFGISRSYISRIEKKAIQKLSAAMNRT